MTACKKTFWLLLLIAGLLMCLGSPTTLHAQEARVDLTLRMLPEYYYKEVIPGEDNALYMEVINHGDEVITDIRFDADEPSGWVVEFIPASLETLSADSSQMIDIRVVPGPDTGRGDYYLTIIAEANETRAVTHTSLRVEQGSSFWLWVGLGVGALVIIGFIIIFFRFGRQ